MNISEAAKILGLSERTLRRAIKNGALQAREFKGKHGKEYEINPESLKAYTAGKSEQTVIHTEATERQSGRSVATLDNGGTIDKSLSMESVATFLTQLNSFISNLRTLDSKGGGKDGLVRISSELPDICTVQEAAIYLGVGPQKVRDFITEGKLKGVRLGRGLKVSKFSLELFRKKLFGR